MFAWLGQVVERCTSRLGDLNINLESTHDEMDDMIAEEIDFCALTDMSRNFRQRRKHFSHRRWVL